jgi:hypothetical protein
MAGEGMDLHDLMAGLYGVSAVAAVYIAVRIGWIVLRWVWRGLCRLCLPMERKVLLWLQDRATSRALGIDTDIIKMRRRIDFPDD